MVNDQQFASVVRERGLLSDAQLGQLQALAASRHTSLYRASVESRAIEEETAVRIAAKLLGVKAVSLKGFSAPAELAKLYPTAMLEQHRFVPISLEQSRLFVAMEDPTDAEALRIAGELWSGTVATLLVGPLDLVEVLKRLRGATAAPGPRAEPFRFAEPGAGAKVPKATVPPLGGALLSKADAERMQRAGGGPARPGPIDVVFDEGEVELETTSFRGREASVPEPFMDAAMPGGQVSSPFLLSLGDSAQMSPSEAAAKEIRQASSDDLVRALVRALVSRGLVTEAELVEQLHRRRG